MRNKLLLAATMVFLASANGFAEAGQRPNILWIIAEDMSEAAEKIINDFNDFNV